MTTLHWLTLATLCSLAACAGSGRGSAGPTETETPETSVPSESPYARWTHGPSTDPSWFPLGVWVQSPANAAAYRDIGINLYVGLWQGPTEAQLEDLRAAGLRTICAQNELGLAHVDDPVIAGWMHGDEPDNAQPDPEGEGWGAAVPPADLQADYGAMVAADPSRPVFLNLGQGVANDDWVGRAAPREDYPEYVAATDIVSFDVYPVAGIRRDDGERFLHYVAKGVDSLRHWGGDIVWNVIETTRISSERAPTPAQVRAEVWMSIIAGSRGIVYFCHEFDPFLEAGLLADEAMRAGVADLNAQIQRLAPVLNAATVDDRVDVRVDGEAPVRVLVKAHAGDLWILAAAMRPGAARARFEVSGAASGTVEVVDEQRSVSLASGRFADDFAPDYQVHIYRVPGAAR